MLYYKKTMIMNKKHENAIISLQKYENDKNHIIQKKNN